MKNPSNTSSSPCLTAAQVAARKRKRSILIAIPCFWFVVGILLVVYVHHLAGPGIFAELTIPQFYSLIKMLASAGSITYLLFGYWWLRLDHVERGLQYSIIQTFMGMAFTWWYFRETRSPREYRRTFWGGLALRFGCIVTCHAGAYAAGMAFIG